MTRAHPNATALQEMLLDARSRTHALVGDLSATQLLGPRLDIVNPPLWEMGHLAWFQERWCLRAREEDGLGDSILAHADKLYDSSAVAHDLRWDLPLLSLDATLRYLRAVLERVLERLSGEPANAQLLYFAQLAALHEEMHCEAFTYTRQTLGYRAPQIVVIAPPPTTARTQPGDAPISGGPFMLGASQEDGFVFDNEKWAHQVDVAPFRIARVAVTNGEFANFVEDAGYTRRELWSAAGWNWRALAAANHPVYWHKQDGVWLSRRFDQIAPLAPARAVVHVNWFEADAYCRWAGRRLPSEAEWEYAASSGPGAGIVKTRYPWGDTAPDALRANLFGMANDCVDVEASAAGDSAWGCRQMIGNVWEWTRDAFCPFPGFVVDPYKDYSQPWFGNHNVLRGGSHATRASLIRNTWRNFYTPDRRDVFAGFRTCAA